MINNVRLRGLKTLFLSLFVGFFAVLSPVLSANAENSARVEAEIGDGYGRIIFSFDSFPDYELEMLDGVLVLKFGEEIDVQVSSLADKLSDYIVVARADPDKTGVRFALAQEVKINKIEAAERLFIDFLPKKWTGLPPSLPEEVIAELAERAEEASIAAREKILQRELKKKKNQLLVRYGELPTFTRLFFDWSLNVETKMERNGDIVSLRFNHYAQPIIKDLKSSPPKYLRKIDYRVTRTELVIELTLEPNTDVRGFKEGRGFVIDLSSGEGGQIERLKDTISDSEIAEMGGLIDGKSLEQQKLQTQQNAKNAISFLAGNDETLAEDGANDEVKPSLLGQQEAITSADKNVEAGAADAKATILPEVQPEAKPEAKPETKPEAKPETKPNANEIVGKQSVKIALNEVKDEDKPEIKINVDLPARLADTSTDDKMEADKNDQPEVEKVYRPIETDAKKVKIEVARNNREYQIIFPFETDVAIAAFERDELFWLVFEQKINFDITELETAAPELIEVYDVRMMDESTTIRLKLDRRLLSHIRAQNSDWILSLGELVLMDTKVLKLDRKYKQNGHAIVQIDFTDLGKVHWFTDEKIGDRIAVVTAKGPARGLLKTHNFVEFAALPTVHGLVFQAIADDVNVLANFDQVVVSSRQGLSLTVGQSFSSQVDNLSSGEIILPSSIEFRDMDDDADEFLKRRRDLRELVYNSESETDQSIYRLELVELMLSYQLANEALGLLAFEKFKVPLAANSSRFKSLQGAAYTLAGQYKNAINTLSSVAIRSNRTAALFRAYALSKTGVYQEALKEFDASSALLGQLPAEMEAEFLTAAIEAALQIPNLNVAQQHLIMLRNVMVTDYQKANYWLLMAHFSRMNDETAEAILRFKAAVEFDVRPINAEALGYLSILEYQTGKITIDEAIDQLNGNIVTWRGDKIEQKNIVSLGRLYMDNGDFRQGLTVLKQAAANFDPNEMGRDAAKYMASIFESLYLGGKANELPPYKALSLFYDFRDLTPVGRKGDEMIRNLADRLIDVDLLDQAIELLDHQVYKRLKGIAKADVASKLAMVQLLNYQPENAIQTIAKSRIASMPKHIARKRDVLEARALVEIGRVQSAIIRLEGYVGQDISIIKSEAYWRGSFWQQAGEEFEKMVLNRWQDDVPLLDNERHILLRSAIAYKMANDELSLGRLRKQFMRKMENTSHAGSFTLVVDEDRTDAIEFRKLAREIAEIDMLKEFIDDYRSNEELDIRDRAKETIGG
ncbi:MAG: hypothetical protein HRU29_05410 [Rhizobiales bacterium]|nr:hypothetical protein [Hyphomicrobiales bacterium]NRB13821.1 hypothetical protein [Hyphomicrobiales bacterium]